MEDWLQRHKVHWWFKLLRFFLILLLAFVYLYTGYHIRDHIIDFGEVKYVEHPGVLEQEYISNADEVVLILKSDRWLTNVFVVAVMTLCASIMLFLISLKKSHFVAGLFAYGIMIVMVVAVMLIISIITNSESGYMFARFFKDHYIHTPFAFVILAAGLRAFDH